MGCGVCNVHINKHYYLIKGMVNFNDCILIEGLGVA